MKSHLIRKLACAVATAAAICGGGSSVRADYAASVQALNPVVYYKLNEAATKVPVWWATNLGSAGALSDGIYVGDDTIFTEPSSPGPITGDPTAAAVNFTGSGSPYPMAVMVGWSTNINPFPAFTAECWVQYNGSTSGELLAPFASINGSSSGYVGTGRSGWTFYANGTQWNWRMGDPSGYIVNFTDSGVAPFGIQVGTWTHLVGVCDGTNAFLYENGKLAGEQALARPFFGNTGQTTDIGFSSSFGRNIDGAVAECAIYPYALTSNQAAAHFAAASSSTYKQVILNDHPSGYWRLNDGAFTAPATNTYPLAVNSGTLSTAANGLYLPGTRVGAPGVPFPGFGANTNAAYFNGVLSGIQIPAIPVQTASFTFTGWILSVDPQQGDIGDPGYPALFCQGDVDNYVAVSDPVWVGYYGNSGVGYAGAVLNALWWEGTTNPAAVADFGDQPNPPVLPIPYIWNFVAAVWTPTGTTLYLNGQPSPLVGAGPHTTHDFSAAPLWLAASDDMPYSGGLVIGANSDTGNCDWMYEGYMAHPALFSTALSASQIQGLYAAAMPLAQVTSLTASPVAPNYEGQTITLTVTTLSPSTNSYQWRKNGSAQSGQTAASYVLSNVTTNNSGSYDVIITDTYGSVTSSPIVLSIAAVPPVIITQPQPATRYTGSPATFSVSAIGSTPITYLWSLGSSPINGATNSSYTAIAGPATAGNYSVLLSNPHGNTPSSNALLTALPSPVGYPAAVIAAQPAAYWRFGETSGTVAHDYVGGNDGNMVENVSNSVPGPVFPGLEANNLSFGFDGVGTKVRVPVPIPVNSNTITTVALAQTSATLTMPQYGCILVSTRAPNDVAYFCVGAVTTDLCYDWNDSTNTYNFDPGEAGANTNFVFTPGTWAFVAEAVSATNAVLYMDNGNGYLAAVSNYVSSYSLLVTNPVLALNGEVDLGGDANLNTGDNRTWAGGLDEIAYWKRTLSPQEIAALHTALITKASPPITLSASLSGGNVQITFSGGTLQSTTNLTVPFANVSGSPTSPYVAPRTGSAQFFRVKG